MTLDQEIPEFPAGRTTCAFIDWNAREIQKWINLVEYSFAILIVYIW